MVDSAGSSLLEAFLQPQGKIDWGLQTSEKLKETWIRVGSGTRRSLPLACVDPLRWVPQQRIHYAFGSLSTWVHSGRMRRDGEGVDEVTAEVCLYLTSWSNSGWRSVWGATNHFLAS